MSSQGVGDTGDIWPLSPHTGGHCNTCTLRAPVSSFPSAVLSLFRALFIRLANHPEVGCVISPVYTWGNRHGERLQLAQDHRVRWKCQDLDLDASPTSPPRGTAGEAPCPGRRGPGSAGSEWKVASQKPFPWLPWPVGSGASVPNTRGQDETGNGAQLAAALRGLSWTSARVAGALGRGHSRQGTCRWWLLSHRPQILWWASTGVSICSLFRKSAFSASQFPNTSGNARE